MFNILRTVQTSTLSATIRRLSTTHTAMASSPIKLFTGATPNGYQVSILLEELKNAYPSNEALNYETRSLKFSTNEQKEPWFLKINPNGRIPAIVDGNRNEFAVFETAAILLYLTQHYDKEYKFTFDPVNDPDNYSEALQWIFFSHGGVAPMQGQAGHFFHAAPEKIPYGINRYIEETKRLYSVLNDRLSGGREYLAGSGSGKFSIADIKAFPWVRAHGWVGVGSLEEPFPNLAAWLERIEQRPAVFEGLGVPTRGQKRTKEEIEEYAKQAQSLIAQGQQK